jgi:hypothetical protein
MGSDTDPSRDDSEFVFGSQSKRGVGRWTDDLIAFLAVGTYLGIWAASYAFADIPRPPLSDATVMMIAEISVAWVFGKKAYERIKNASKSK